MKDFTILDLLNRIERDRRLLISIKEKGLGYNLRIFVDDVELSIKQLISDNYFKIEDGYSLNKDSGLPFETKEHLKAVDTYMNQNIAPYIKKEKIQHFKIFRNKVYRAFKIR